MEIAVRSGAVVCGAHFFSFPLVFSVLTGPVAFASLGLCFAGDVGKVFKRL
jgi:hypothetical protein